MQHQLNACQFPFVHGSTPFEGHTFQIALSNSRNLGRSYTGDTRSIFRQEASANQASLFIDFFLFFFFFFHSHLVWNLHPGTAGRHTRPLYFYLIRRGTHPGTGSYAPPWAPSPVLENDTAPYFFSMKSNQGAKWIQTEPDLGGERGTPHPKYACP